MKFLKQKGFSLIELMVVVTIIIILASLIMVGLSKAMKKANYVNCQNNMKQLGNMLQQYTLRFNGMYPQFSEYRWIGQIDYLEGGEFGWKKLSEYPGYEDDPDAATGNEYYLIYPRDNELFVCPTGKRQRMNLQGVRTNYSGLSVRDYAGVDSINEPHNAILLLEYEANESHILTGDDPNGTTFISDSITPSDEDQPLEVFRIAQNHTDCGNILFVDNHLECVQGESLVLMNWEEDYSTSTTSTSTTSVSTSVSTTSTTVAGNNGGGGGGGGGGDDDDDDDDSGGGGGGGGDGGGDGDDDDDDSNNSDDDDGDSNEQNSTVSSTSSVSTSSSSTTSTARVYIGPPF